VSDILLEGWLTIGDSVHTVEQREMRLGAWERIMYSCTGKLNCTFGFFNNNIFRQKRFNIASAERVK
jgi:hypothetical protein